MRGWIAIAVIPAIAVAAIFVYLAFYQPAPAPPPKIVVATLDFVIQSPDAGALAQRLVELSQRGDVAGVVLVINSPGGTVSDTEALYATLRGLGKPKYAVVYGLAASGAYYVAAAADKIYATPSSWVGSIGVIAVIWPDEYLYDAPDYVYTTGPLKYYGMDLTSFYNAVEEVRNNFVKAVAEGRRGRLRVNATELETAALYTASQALEMGLVDKIGGVPDAVRDMAQELGLREYQVEYLKPLNATRGAASQRASLSALLNSTPLPIFYLWPPALQIDIRQQQTPPPAASEVPAGTRYVVLDAAHNNVVPKGFLEVLRAELAKRGYALVAAATEDRLASLLSNATALVVVNPATPFSPTAVRAVLNATKRGVKVAYFYDVRASGIVTVGGTAYIAPYGAVAAPDTLPMYFNMSGLRAVYNYTAGAAAFDQNWQIVAVEARGNWTLLRGVARLVLFSPSAVAANAPHRLEAWAYAFGYGWGNYTVAAQAGNFLFIGAVRSFTPYFIQLGDNHKFFSNVVDWLTSQ